MQLIKANEATAGRRILVFPMLVDATDLNSPETGEAAGQPQISVDGGANWTNTNGTLTGGTNGAYQVQLTQAEVNQAVGTTIIGRYKSDNTAEARAIPIQIVAFDPNATADLGLTNLDAAISTRGTADTGDAMTLTEAYDAAKSAASASDVTTAVSGLSTFNPATDEVDIGAVKGVAVASVADFKADVSGLALTGEAATAVGTLNDFDPATDVVAHVTLVDTTTTNTDMRGTNGAELSGAAAAAVATLHDFDPATDVVAHVTLVDTVTTNTDMRGTDGAELTGAAATAVAGLNDLSALEAQTAAGAAITAAGLALAGEAAAAVGTLTIPTAEAISDQVWNEATADHQTAGSTGKALTDAGSAGDPWGTSLPGEYGAGTAGAILGTNLDATVSSRSTLTADQVWTNGTRTLSSFGTLVADTAAAVWAALSRTITGGTVTTNNDKAGYALSTAGVTAVQSGLATAAAVTSLDGKVDIVDGIADAIKLKTDTLPASPAAVGSAMTLANGAVSAAAVAADAVTEIQSGLATTANVSAVSTKVDTVDTVVDAIKAKTDNLPASPAATGAAMTLTAGERSTLADTILDEEIDSASATADSARAALKAAWAQGFGKWTLVGTTFTLYGPDGSSVVREFTLDSATAPTERVPA